MTEAAKTLSFEKIVSNTAGAALLLLCLKAFATNIDRVLQSSDTAWLIKTGQYILSHGLPTSDPFSFTRSQESLVIYQWLFSVLSGSLYTAGGLWLVGMSTAILAALIYLWLLPSKMLTLAIKPVYVFGLLSFIMTPAWFWARPQLFSFFFILVFTHILETFRSQGKEKPLWLIPPLLVLWANTHSFWFIGLGMTLLYLGLAIKRTDKTPKQPLLFLLLILLSSFLAILINPYGWGLIQYNLSFLSEPDFGSIRELQPTLWQNPLLNRNLLAYFLFAWIILIWQRKTIPVEGLILSAISTTVAFCFYRFAPVAVLLTWPFLALGLSQNSFFKQQKKQSQLRQNTWGLPILAIATAIAAFIFHFKTPEKTWFTYSENNYVIVQFLKAHPEIKHRLFCDPTIGCSLILENLGPVFVDTRFDFYGKQFCQEVNDCLNNLCDWQSYFQKWQVSGACIVNDTPLYQELQNSPAWLLTFDDGISSLWLPNTVEGKNIWLAIMTDLHKGQFQAKFAGLQTVLEDRFARKHTMTGISYLHAKKLAQAKEEFKQALLWKPGGLAARAYKRLSNTDTSTTREATVDSTDFSQKSQ